MSQLRTSQSPGIEPPVDEDNPYHHDPSGLLSDEYENFERQNSCSIAEEYVHLMSLLEPDRINPPPITPQTNSVFTPAS
jgi:hypothetical protein